MKIKKNDTVIVRSGKDKGKTGKVLRAFPREMKVLVEGVNIKKNHNRAGRGKKGEIVEKSYPISVSVVSLLDPKTNKPTRVGVREEKGKKVRVAKKSGQVI